MSIPKISIVIPCYNVEHFVRRCIKSIVEQNYSNLEIICINDGSTDNTLCILKELQQDIACLKIIDQKNKGLSGSRNVGILEATGEYIMFVDSDDWLAAAAISKTFETEFDLICFSYNRIFKNGSEPRVFNLEGVFPAAFVQRRILGLIGEELRDPSQTNSLVTAWAKIYRKRVIIDNKIKFINTSEIGTEDALFNLQYLECCKDFVKIIDEPLYNYLRFNSNSLTANYKTKLQLQWQTLHAKMALFAVGKGNDFEEAYGSRIVLSLIGLGLNEMIRKDGFAQIYKGLSNIINHIEYKKAIRKIDLHYFPFHWKFLFWFAKYRCTAGVYIMIRCMSILLNRKNN